MRLIVASETPSEAAAFMSLLLTAGMHYDDPKSKLLVNNKNSLALLVDPATKFYKEHGGLQRPWKQFIEWVKSPPTVATDEKLLPYEESVEEIRSKALISKVLKDPALSHEEAKTVIATLAWCRSGSQTSFLTLRKFGAVVGLPPEVLSLLKVEAGSQDSDAKKLVALLKKNGLEVRPNLKLSIPEAKAFREKNEKAATEYSRLRQSLLKVYGEELRNFIRAAGGPQPVEAVRKHMQSRGILVHKIPDGFVGQIGEDGSLYTVTGRKINGNSSTRVHMNPKYDPQLDNGFVFKAESPTGGKPLFVFTSDWAEKKREEKFGVAKELEANLDKIRGRYIRDMKGADKEKRVLATMLELQYMTAMRIGNAGNATKNAQGEVEQTYGLSTLLVSQVKIRGPGLLLEYPGKKGVISKFTLTPADAISKRVIDNVKSMLVNEDGEPKLRKEYVFEDSSGRYSADRVNKYLKAVSGIKGITNHKIRHMRGTAMAREVLVGAPKRLDQAAAEKWFLTAMNKVGKLLNHVKGVGAGQQVTPLTALKNYIDPAVSLGFFEERGLRVPKFLVPLRSRKA